MHKYTYMLLTRDRILETANNLILIMSLFVLDIVDYGIIHHAHRDIGSATELDEKNHD